MLIFIATSAGFLLGAEAPPIARPSPPRSAAAAPATNLPVSKAPVPTPVAVPAPPPRPPTNPPAARPATNPPAIRPPSAPTPAPPAARIPAAEKLLPEDTLLMLSIPDFARAREIFSRSPQYLLWHDPAMKAFTDKFHQQMEEQLIAPLERELNLRWADCTALPQGQFTLALIPASAPGGGGVSTGMLLLLDARDQRGMLTTNLAELKKKWVDAGRTLRTEKIRGRDFAVLMASASEVPRSVKDVFSPTRTFIDPTGGSRPPTPVTPSPEQAEAAARKREYFIGQVDSLLLLSTDLRALDQLLARLGGAQMPALEDSAAFAASRGAHLRDAPVYGWINPRPFMDVLGHQLGERPDPAALSSGAPENVFFITLGTARLLAAMGFGNLKGITFSMTESADGSHFQMRASVPEADRKGLVRILAGESTQISPPPFVPADAASFWRWRVDGPKAWGALDAVLKDLSPTLPGTFNWLVDSAAEAAKVRDPSFDLRRTITASLGNDILGFEKAAPAGAAVGDPTASRSLYLVSSPQPEQLAAALRALFVLLPQAEGTDKAREFLGHKIYSAVVPVLPGSDPPKGGPRILSYAATQSGVAMSTDLAFLEGYLRGQDARVKPLREAPGFAELAQAVVGAGASYLSYENESETARVTFETLKRDPGAPNDLSMLLPLPSSFSLLKSQVGFRNWMDASLLPPFERVAKYFSTSAWAVSASTEGLWIRFFAPAPRELKKPPPG